MPLEFEYDFSIKFSFGGIISFSWTCYFHFRGPVIFIFVDPLFSFSWTCYFHFRGPVYTAGYVLMGII